jgi:probable rRNA maturation factor
MPQAARKPRTAPKNLPRRASKEASKAVSKAVSRQASSKTPGRTPKIVSKATSTKAPKIDILAESALWKRQTDVKSAVRRAIAEAAAVLSTPRAELVIVLTDDSAIRLLNRDWRGIDAATNVLSFPTADAPGDPPLIGDIVLAYETIDGEARIERKPFAHHVAHLAVHGFLHLLGYDHEREKDAEAMERTERTILRRLAIPDPYLRITKP